MYKYNIDSLTNNLFMSSILQIRKKIIVNKICVRFCPWLVGRISLEHQLRSRIENMKFGKCGVKGQILEDLKIETNLCQICKFLSYKSQGSPLSNFVCFLT